MACSATFVIGDIAVIRQGALLLHRSCERINDRPGVETAVAVGEEAPHLAVHRAQQVAALSESLGEDGLEIVGEQFARPRLGGLLQAVDET